MIQLEEEKWVEIFDQLADNDYVFIDDFISKSEQTEIVEFIRREREAGQFTAAGIGTLDTFTVDRSIRKDWIRWLNYEAEPAPVKVYLDNLKELLQLLNRYCYLSLSGYELHYAHYAAGSFYKRHLDQFKNHNNRMISVILYLNQNWQPEHGGMLRLYLKEGEKDVAPIGGRLLIFRSNILEHEVLMAHQDRYSITGWLLYQPPGLGFLT
jgi:SM-20-related protein